MLLWQHVTWLVKCCQSGTGNSLFESLPTETDKQNGSQNKPTLVTHLSSHSMSRGYGLLLKSRTLTEPRYISLQASHRSSCCALCHAPAESAKWQVLSTCRMSLCSSAVHHFLSLW